MHETLSIYTTRTRGKGQAEHEKTIDNTEASGQHSKRFLHSIRTAAQITEQASQHIRPQGPPIRGKGGLNMDDSREKQNEGFLKILNGELRGLASAPLSGPEFRIVLTVLSLTTAFRRDKHEISLSYIENYTGLKKSQISRSIKRLEDLGILDELWDGPGRGHRRQLCYNSGTVRGFANTEKAQKGTEKKLTQSELLKLTQSELLDGKKVNSELTKKDKVLSIKDKREKEKGERPIFSPSEQTERAESKEAQSREQRHIYGEYKNVYLSDTEMQSLKDSFPDNYKELIENLSIYMQSTGKLYKDHLATIKRWAQSDREKAEQKQSTQSAQSLNSFTSTRTDDDEAELYTIHRMTPETVPTEEKQSKPRDGWPKTYDDACCLYNRPNKYDSKAKTILHELVLSYTGREDAAELFSDLYGEQDTTTELNRDFNFVDVVSLAVGYMKTADGSEPTLERPALGRMNFYMDYSWNDESGDYEEELHKVEQLYNKLAKSTPQTTTA